MAFTKDEIWKCDLVRAQSSAACDGAADVARRQAAETVELCPAIFWDECESPIEAVFLVWWMAISDLVFHGSFHREWTIHPQTEVEVGGRRYRIDIEVVPIVAERSRFERLRTAGYVRPRIAIELDGHEFHERTREQVAYRNERDRSLQQAGWRVMHYSGAELVRDPMKVIQEVLDVCHRIDEEADEFNVPK